MRGYGNGGPSFVHCCVFFFLSLVLQQGSQENDGKSGGVLALLFDTDATTPSAKTSNVTTHYTNRRHGYSPPNDTRPPIQNSLFYTKMRAAALSSARARHNNQTAGAYTWPYREQVAVVEGDITIGGLMMVHERDEKMICGKIMPQGGLQAAEAMLYTLDQINARQVIPGVVLGARIKDDCDRDIYGLEQAVDFISGELLGMTVVHAAYAY